MRSNKNTKYWAKYLVGCLSFLCIAPVHAYQQVPVLDGPSVSVDGVLGVRCSAGAGDSPSIYAQGGSHMDNETVMFGIVVPLHPSTGNCSKILGYEEAMARLAIAEQLLERGMISMDDYKELADEVHSIISSK